MSVWNCPTHGRVAPEACCESAVRESGSHLKDQPQGPVIDLMEALKNSLAKTAAERAEKP